MADVGNFIQWIKLKGSFSVYLLPYVGNIKNWTMKVMVQDMEFYHLQKSQGK